MRCGKRISGVILTVFTMVVGIWFGAEAVSAFAAEETVTVSSGAGADEIQNALDWNAYGNYDKLTVKIPAGTYYLDGTLYIYSNTTILADKNAVFKKMDNHNGAESYGAMLEGKLMNDRGGYGNCHDIAVIGGVWDSKEVMNNTVGTETFRFIHCDNVTVKDAVLCNVPDGSHLIVLAGTRNALIENCEFYGYGGDGVKNPKEAVQLDVAHNAEIVPTAQENEVNWDDLPCENVTITNCNFHDFSRAIGSHTAVKGVLHNNVVISDNTITNMADTAVKLFNYKNTTVTGNTITKCAEGVLVYSDMPGQEYLPPLSGKTAALPASYEIKVENNTIKNMSMNGDDWGDAVRVMGSENIPIKGVYVNNNTMDSMERYGVYVTDAENVTVCANKVTGCGKIGLYATTGCTKVTFERNLVNDCGGYGIFMANSVQGAIVGNTVSAAGKTDKEQIHGIYVYKCSGTDKKSGTKISKNIVTGTSVKGSQGIRVSTTDFVSVTGNRVAKTEETGIYLYTCQNAEILSNSVLETGKNGVYLTTKCDGATVSKNCVSATKDLPIMIYQAPKSVLNENNVTVAKGLEGGIRISQSDNSTAKNNIVSGAPKNKAVYATGSIGCTITETKIQ